jgi:Bacterial regulatory helix-turn-helix proteins, AraC family
LTWFWTCAKWRWRRISCACLPRLLMNGCKISWMISRMNFHYVTFRWYLLPILL